MKIAIKILEAKLNKIKCIADKKALLTAVSLEKAIKVLKCQK